MSALREFADMAKAKPESVMFATSVIGSASHLDEALFNRVADVDIMTVPYKANAPALNNVMGGRRRQFHRRLHSLSSGQGEALSLDHQAVEH